MIRMIQDNRAAIEALCRRFNVARLEVFGSAANDEFDVARSDVDFLVEFKPLEPAPLADAYFVVPEKVVVRRRGVSGTADGESPSPS